MSDFYPSDTRYAVSVVNQPVRYFDSMMDALTDGAKRVYMGPDTWRAAITALNANRTFDWAYGFTDATIYPPSNLARGKE